MKTLLSWLSGWTQYNHQTPYKRRQEIRGEESNVVMEPETGVMGPPGKECCNLKKTKEAKE